jgi:DNA polymerase I-like protein with 3'-5' exonuclease and polymerase domains
MKVQVIDFETKISSTCHGPMAKWPENDFCTTIWGNHPERVQCTHNPNGFKRILGVAGEILSADILVGHNLPFDLAYIIDYYKTEKRIPQTWDTQIAEYLMTGQRHSTSSLAELQVKYLGGKIKKDRISKLYKKGIGADKIIQAKARCKRLWKLYEQYCIDDGATTLQVFKAQYTKVKQMGMLPIIKLYNQYMMALVFMMAEGINVDLNGCEKTIREFKLKEIALLQEASEIIKKYWTDERLPEFKITSPTHKSAILFGGCINCRVVRENGTYKDGRTKTKIFEELVPVIGMGLPLSLTQESKIEGRYQTDTGVIHNVLSYSKEKNLPEVHRYCELQIQAMNYKKMVSTYLKPFIDKSINGKLFPHFNNTAVITGRLSSSAPNFQNIPAKGEMNSHIQGKLVAPEGWVCVSSDYSQLEMFVAAWNSKDEQLTKDLQEGLDFHCQSLAFAEQLSYEDVFRKCKIEKDKEYEAKRSKAKGITFQKEYGAGVKTVAEGTGLDESLVQKVFDALDEKYWKLKLFKEHVHTTSVNNQYPSLAKHIPANQKKGHTKDGRRFNNRDEELLPIYQGNNKYYDPSYIRNVGYYKMPHGKLYSFEEYAKIGYHGEVRRGLSVPQIKNYTSQGGAADVMAAATVELMEYTLQHQDDVKMVNTIHDSNWFYIKKEKLNLTLKEIERIMCDVPKALKKHLNVDLPFKFMVESKIGPNFSEMEVWKG